MPEKPFVAAEKYIQLRKKFVPTNWADTVTLLTDMVLSPLIMFFLFFIGNHSIMNAMTLVKSYQVWSEYLEFVNLRFAMQRMMMYMHAVGGPFIVTNDTTYMPYVFADAVVRTT